MPLPKPAPRERLRPGQRSRAPIQKLGKVGRAWEPFRQTMLRKWFDEALGKGQLPEVNSAGWEIVTVYRQHLPGEAHEGKILRRVGCGGVFQYKADGIQVGHKPGHGQDRRPDQRHDPNAVQPQSPRFNAHLETIAQPKTVHEEEPC